MFYALSRVGTASAEEENEEFHGFPLLGGTGYLSVTDMKTMKTEIVNVKDTEYDVYIGRKNRHIGEKGSFLANIFSVKMHGREGAIARYRVWFHDMLKNAEFKSKILALRGKTLGCWCKPLSCHGDVIVRYLNYLEQYNTMVPGTDEIIGVAYTESDAQSLATDLGRNTYFKKVNSVISCKVCGAPTEHPEFCSGLCESEWIEVMEAMDELQVDPSFYIEQYAEEHRPTIVRTLRRIGVIA